MGSTTDDMDSKKEEKFLPLLGIETGYIVFAVRNLVAIPTAL
jgi:hypothetical protein